MQEYKIVLFDADGTLFDFDKSESAAFSSALGMCGVVERDGMISAYKEINHSLWAALERGEIEREVLAVRRFELFCEHFGLSIDAKELSQNYILSLGKMTFLIDGAEELLSNLYGKVKMYIITNGLKSVQRSRYALSNISHFFEDIFISEEIGANKPEKAFFDYVAEHIEGFSCDSALVVGDSLSADILGGNRYGLDTCWISMKAEKNSEIVPKFVVHSLCEIEDIVLGVGREKF